MKPQVNALARFKARTSTRRTLQHQARQPSPYGPTSAAKTTASRQQVRQALRHYASH